MCRAYRRIVRRSRMPETAAMDPLLLPTPEPQNRLEQFTAFLQTQRERARELLAARRARLERAEDALEQHLRRLEEQAARRTAAASEEQFESVAGDDYRRRYEMALDDLRNLKAEHAELQRQLAQARSITEKLPAGEPIRGGNLDWEAEKHRILAALDSDFDQSDPAQRAERLRIEEVLQATERAIAEKNRETHQLQRRLQQQDRDAKVETERPAAIDRAIDDDAVIRKERERLEQLQEQWREKLCQAEVDLSMERAKLARQRAELDERGHSPETNEAKAVEQPARGRWLARLGLTEADRVRRKQR